MGELEILRFDVEEHAVCLAVAEGHALGVSLTKSLASGESVFCAGRFEVVRGS